MTAYLFDIDGVLTDPVEKRVTEPTLLDIISKVLAQGDPVALNTGRALAWIEERVLPAFLAKVQDTRVLARFIIIGEKGETWKVWDVDGTTHQETTEGLIMPEALREQFKDLIEKRYSDEMFFDDTKTVMITAEMHDKYSIPKFQEKKNQFIKELEGLLKEMGLDGKYMIHRDDISVSVEHKHVGKALGAKRFLTFLQDRHLTPEKFYCFGDTTTDIDMADELHRQGKEVTFIYTGNKEKLGEIPKSYPIVFAEGYSQGTLEYLKSHQLEMAGTHS